MTYEIGDLPFQTLLPRVALAEDQLARLDEIVRRSPVGEGFAERGHFLDAAGSMWNSGELLHVEDLVFHDAHMDIRSPTHELVIGHGILRARRRMAGAAPGWAVSEAGISALTGAERVTQSKAPGVADERGGEGADEPPDEDDDPLSRELAHIDAVLERSRRVLNGVATPAVASEKPSLVVGGLVIRDAEWHEKERLSQWQSVRKHVADLPPVLSAALLFDAWEIIQPLQRQHWLGGQLVATCLRAQGKVVSHLPALNVGLKAVPRERRRSHDRTKRLLAFLDAMCLAAEAGMKEIARLDQSRQLMERKLRGRRSTSSLPAAIELFLSRPMVSAAMVAKAANVTPRGALNLIAELGVREMTGRGSYRAWGIL
ncbi:HTH DNA binding domain-containing protein [Bosea sp. CRIB-10]|uniref:RHE_PE00001 family protein n=1 Tax=Bosea sp. CRIB-10 TaxID=378404 RepID=UPI0008EB1229|nr:RHE_PE00001 family protein [Bosea sp. CRIB-10]SFC84178.1 HTH DNA binding domain-containing protein [Bosea sp. CRIB-10]